MAKLASKTARVLSGKLNSLTVATMMEERFLAEGNLKEMGKWLDRHMAIVLELWETYGIELAELPVAIKHDEDKRFMEEVEASRA